MNSGNSSVSLQPACDLWEYVLVVRPDENVNNKVIAVKKAFAKTHDYELAVNTLPHITMTDFLMKEAMEEIVIKWIQNICRLNTSFSVMINNFSGFPPHTIYLRVQNPQPFQKLVNALKIVDGFIQSNDCPPLRLVTKPHLPIATGLPEHLYNEAMKEYAKKSFHSGFEVDKLFLLKKDADMKYQLVNTFILPPPLTLFN